MTKTTILMTSIIAMTFIVLVTTSSAYAQVSNFYWTETTGGFGNFNGEVFAADSATKTVTQVTSGGFDRIDDVELDPLAGKLWWNNWDPGFFNAGLHEGIYSSNLDGTGQVQVTGAAQSTTTTGFASGLTGLVLDPVAQQVFFTRGVSYAQNFPPNSGGEVSRVNMDGTGYLKLNINNDSWHPDGIELDSSTNTLLWGDPGVVFGITATGPVNCMDTSGGNRQVAQFPFAPHLGRSLALDAANGLLFYSSHATSGQIGRSSGGGIFVTSPCPSVAPTQVLTDPDTGIPDIELDAANMRIYWTDYARNEIRSASYDAAGTLSGITTELSGLQNPYGLALELQTTIPVEIDIKPGSDPSSVSCKNDKGNVPVAVFGSNTFDATTIDLASLELNGVPVTEAHNKLHIDDINNDGFDDAVLHLDKTGVCDATSNEVDYPLKASADATLTGSNADGDFEGIGDIRIVKR